MGDGVNDGDGVSYGNTFFIICWIVKYVINKITMKDIRLEKNRGKSNLFTGSNTFDTNLLLT